MNFPGYMAGISIVGALIGIFSVTSVWASGMTGIDFIDCPLDGFQKFLPVIILVIAIVAAGLSAVYIVRPRLLLPFLTFFLGVVIMILTSLFSMWELDGTKIVADAGIGFWLSYVSGAVILLGSAVSYSAFMRMPPY